MDRRRKEELVAELRDDLASATLVVVTHQMGLTVAESSLLRREMRAGEARFRVTKNTLARLALQGSRFAYLIDHFNGPTAIVVSRDPVAAARVAVAFSKQNEKLQIIAGGLGDQELTVASVRALAALPSLDGLRARLIGAIQGPATKLAATVQAPAAQLARVFSAYGASAA